jgi:uncharacterized peroxidase-related enzyme
MSRTFLSEPDPTPDVEALYASDVADTGYVMNLSRVWAHHPPTQEALSAQLQAVTERAGLSFRDRGVLVAATASTYGDSYCALAWGNRLARASDGPTAAGVLTGDDAGLDGDRERALAAWARKVARDPHTTTADDVAALRSAGFDDAQVLAITTYVALRIAFSTVNAALGARPDAELRTDGDPEVAAAVTWGRP